MNTPLAGQMKGADRRRGLRVRQLRPIKVFVPSAGRYLGGQTEDISPTGLRLELPVRSPLMVGGVVEVYVDFGAPARLTSRRRMAAARVVWVDRDAAVRAGRMAAGIEFLTPVAAIQTNAA